MAEFHAFYGNSANSIRVTTWKATLWQTALITRWPDLKDWHQTTGAEVPTITNPQFDQGYTKDRYESIGYE